MATTRFPYHNKIFLEKEKLESLFCYCSKEFRKKFLGLLVLRRLKYRLLKSKEEFTLWDFLCHNPQASKKALLCIKDTSILDHPFYQI